MGKRFLNTKTRRVCLGEDIHKEVNLLLQKYVPYQKVMVITSSSVFKNNTEYIESFLKELQNPSVSYVFNGKIDAKKAQAAKLLQKVKEEVACVIVLGDNKLINLVKVVSFIQEVPYIIIPTSGVEPQQLCKIAGLKIDNLTKFYKVNAPLAVLVDRKLVKTFKKSSFLNTFCQTTSLSMMLLEEVLMNCANAKSQRSGQYENLYKLVHQTLNLDSKLYNWQEEALDNLINYSLRSGLILQSVKDYNLDATSLCATALKMLGGGQKISTSYYKMVSSLFLLNLYENFVVNIKSYNYIAPNLKARLQRVAHLEASEQIRLNLISNLSPQVNHAMYVYCIKEFEKEMLQELFKAKKVMLKAYAIFKRMSIKQSFKLEKSLKEEDIKNAICLAPDLSCSNNFLKIMCNFGVLDYNF